VNAIGLEQAQLDLISGALLILILFANPNGIAYANVQAVRKVAGRRLRKPHPLGAGDDGPHEVAPRRLGATLDIEHLTVRFGGVVAVDDVSLSVHPGEVVGLIGPNGAGKTTVIEAVTGFVRVGPATRLRLDGVPIDGWSPTARSRAGLGRSFQTLELFEDITVGENLLVACDDRNRASYASDLLRPGRPRLTALARQAVRELGLSDELDVHPDELSHGRRRLVAIARSIAASPSVLLLDEPAAGLSTAETSELGRSIRRLASEMGLAVVLIEHDVGLVLSTCDRVAVMDFGRLIALGPPAEVAADPAVIAAYLGEPETEPAAR
jgi:sulfate-transporting ATPase